MFINVGTIPTFGKYIFNLFCIFSEMLPQMHRFIEIGIKLLKYQKLE